MRLLFPTDTTSLSSRIVRERSYSGEGHSCTGCGGRMFIQTQDGLCPVCRSREFLDEGDVSRIVDEQLEPSDWLQPG